jgi:hypothetical protein
VRMCDTALISNRTPCTMVSSHSPQPFPADPACPRCSLAGHITIFIDSTAKKQALRGSRDKCHIKDMQTGLGIQLAAALKSLLYFRSPATAADDDDLIEPLDETSFVMVEYEDGEEQFDLEGAPPRTSDCSDHVNNSSPWAKLGQGFGGALSGLAFGR